MDNYYKILEEIRLLKDSLRRIEANGATISGWMPKRAVMRVLDYGDTQLRALEISKSIEVSKIGNRKFYSVESIVKLIEKNRQK
jgi:hypothetical protein